MVIEYAIMKFFLKKLNTFNTRIESTERERSEREGRAVATTALNAEKAMWKA